MNITYDPEADVLALTLRQVVPAHGKQISAGVVLLYDGSGEVVGIEILDARQHLDGDPASVSLQVLTEEPAVTPA